MYSPIYEDRQYQPFHRFFFFSFSIFFSFSLSFFLLLFVLQKRSKFGIDPMIVSTMGVHFPFETLVWKYRAGRTERLDTGGDWAKKATWEQISAPPGSFSSLYSSFKEKRKHRERERVRVRGRERYFHDSHEVNSSHFSPPFHLLLTLFSPSFPLHYSQEEFPPIKETPQGPSAPKFSELVMKGASLAPIPNSPLVRWLGETFKDRNDGTGVWDIPERVRRILFFFFFFYIF